ncbi:hypothetical protein JY651_40340 [Pyxidicoccus parkwayensis]|uniref:Tetratricopeptide repeat protein n=1 Tax=Pyxidicoccus parkwayensis TaxID=2813578 RepID=A0ABX7NR77_9BACT|nr:tetratricopeptide repeat protein [Pyxidicoccus parkwaysis]QSQ21374.1 hypothetical protein JY651_40340 [Pyxidicoccus parkwaysis]
MGERELMKLRELKEAAHALFARGRYAQCSETYERILRLAPKDPNVRVRHAESCRRAGDRQSAISSYRMAATLLLEQGCESRARGALRAALELDPRDPMILSDLARLGQPFPINAPEDDRPAASAVHVFERPPAPPSWARGSAAHRAAPGQVVPPPSPPSYIIRAAEETPAPSALPAVPAVAPVNAESLRAAGHTIVPIPMLRPVNARNVAPSITPVIQGRLITQAPVPPSSRTNGAAVPPVLSEPAVRPHMPPALRPSGIAPKQAASSGSTPLTMVPIPRAGDAPTGAPSVMPYRPELRRLGPNAVALRVSPQARWVIIRSDSPLEVSRAESLPVPGDAAPRPSPHP